MSARNGNRGWSLSTLLVVSSLAFLAFTSQANADFGLTEFGVGFSAPNGAQLRQAGSHGDLRTQFAFNTQLNEVFQRPEPEKNVRDIEVSLPPGLVANAAAIPTCSQTKLKAAEGGNNAACPIDSQVGIATVYTSGFDPTPYPVYNLERPADRPALLGFNVLGIVSLVEPTLRPQDGYAISTLSPLISQGQGLLSVDLTLWGVPASPRHDTERFEYRERETGQSTGFGKSIPSHSPERAFLTAPTSCPGTPSSFEIALDSWQNPGVFLHRSVTADPSGEPLTTVGCGREPFAPTTSAAPLSHAAASPSGLTFDLTVPQNESPEGIATAHVRKVSLQFPEGVTISPPAAAGLGSCSPGQIGLGTNDPATCPGSSQLGTVEVETPLIDEPLTGQVFLASQKDNPFGSLYATYLVLYGPGVVIKLAGRLDADPSTGRLTATFDETPQLPFSHLRVALRGGQTAPLAMPRACGTYTTRTEITSWASTVPVVSDSSFAITENCATGRFAPKLGIEVPNPSAGQSSPFRFEVTAASGEANLARIEATLPAGLLAKLAGVPLCGDAAAASGSCPAASRVGSATVGAGLGETPLFVPEPGKPATDVYLGGPYRGAPYSLVVKVPAQAGPFDLGTVVVRNALFVDPETTVVTVASDPLPQILDGVPITYRDVRVDVDRPDFTRNPTSCEPKEVSARLTSATGQSAGATTPYKAAACASLGFAPKLDLRLTGGIHRRQFPALRATVSFPKRGATANIRRAVVALPHSEFLEQGHIKTVCTRVQFSSGLYPGAACPAASVYGRASVVTPLLDRPLSGPVFLRSSTNKLPDLVLALHGGIDIVLDGRIDTFRGGLRTTFAMVPDAPFSKFTLALKGGKKGLIVNSVDLCRRPQRATATFAGQNGRIGRSNPELHARCGRR